MNGVDGIRGNSTVTVSHSRLTANGDGADFGKPAGAPLVHLKYTTG
jgi:hypothetical protein